ncbi:MULTISPECIES: hypothetical protein [Mesorhizobium]|uniref:Uncharacterized protein n=1 Tax=Mesorhizobium shonense TaxID=1209948 RepID=A0ABV2I071_9HYPH|nr:hypothetical protein [Mesorhizobium sp.]RWA84409.1 MAG: hypothetical protein EOQ30_08775 [Mesorhizobium sp.]RWB20844.1 MAG: hypothetical protein EOQ40_13060 [Mesorhizobium sp.]TIS45350.1 MAG: hypothetical protein E5W96_31920 [Mesorhizobium sp.]
MTRLTAAADYGARMREALAQPPVVFDDDPATIAITDWLSRLMLFEGVPLGYLVPDPGMLPLESIRFFAVDDNWVTALVDGAFSIGQAAVGISAGDAAAPQARFKARAVGRMSRQRALKLGMTAGSEPIEGFEGVMSGFVLRSALVDVWPGVEVNGFADAAGTEHVPLVRFDILASGLALGLFAGLVQRVTFAEPAETLHFGIDLQSSQKSLRYIDTEGDNKPGDPVLDSDQQPVTITVPFRSGSSTVVDIATLAQTIQTGLAANSAISDGSPYTAAQFAMELVEGVQEVVFDATAAASAVVSPPAKEGPAAKEGRSR